MHLVIIDSTALEFSEPKPKARGFALLGLHSAKSVKIIPSAVVGESQNSKSQIAQPVYAYSDLVGAIMSDDAKHYAIDDERVRDHLANERTYLAWLRTGASTIGLGVVIAKLKYFLGPNYPETSGIVKAANLGLIFALIGVVTIVLSVFYFLQTRKQIRNRAYRSSVKIAVSIAALTTAIGILIVWYLMQPVVTK